MAGAEIACRALAGREHDAAASESFADGVLRRTALR
jgi:hypothetical protein